MTETISAHPANVHYPDINLLVAARDDGTTYNIVAFQNAEFRTKNDLETALMALGIVAGLFIVPLSFQQSREFGLWGITGPLIYIALLIAAYVFTAGARYVPMKIILDPHTDQFTVCRYDEAVVTRPLSSFQRTTIGRHPEAVRMEEGRKFNIPGTPDKITKIEKLQVLFGFFGPYDAEQVHLVERAEWPDMKTLGTLQSAINVMMTQTVSATTPKTAPPASARKPALPASTRKPGRPLE